MLIKKSNKHDIIKFGNPKIIKKVTEKTKEKVKKRYRILIQQKPTSYYKKSSMRSLTIRDYNGKSCINNIQDKIRKSLNHKKESYKKLKVNLLPNEIFNIISFFMAIIIYSSNEKINNKYLSVLNFIFLSIFYFIAIYFLNKNLEQEVYIKK